MHSCIDNALNLFTYGWHNWLQKVFNNSGGDKIKWFRVNSDEFFRGRLASKIRLCSKDEGGSVVASR